MFLPCGRHAILLDTAFFGPCVKSCSFDGRRGTVGFDNATAYVETPVSLSLLRVASKRACWTRQIWRVYLLSSLVFYGSDEMGTYPGGVCLRYAYIWLMRFLLVCGLCRALRSGRGRGPWRRSASLPSPTRTLSLSSSRMVVVGSP